MTTTLSDNAAVLAWTGERMIPNQSDLFTELFHWQRYLYFRPWYVGSRVIDAASGEGYGTAYAAVFAMWANGFDIAPEAVAHAHQKYPHARYGVSDVCDLDYSEADLVVSFETIEHLPDPIAFLRQLSTCPGRIVISTPNRANHSPGNKLEDKPWNQFHTVEWLPSEFAELIRDNFPGRTVRFLSQEARWPGLIREGLDDSAKYIIAVIGDGELPQWPRLGVSIPTCNNPLGLREAVLGFSRFYPGEVEFVLVANGSTPETIGQLQALVQEAPHMVSLLQEPKNIGYGRGANRGLNHLVQQGRCDYYCVSNDDVMPAIDCLPQMVAAMKELEEGGVKPGVVGPVTNEINGNQKVDIGGYRSYPEMLEKSAKYHVSHANTATQWPQIRGLFLLIHPDLLEAIGGFDPIYGLGNFEDDDWNLRARLAGFSLWIADGSFLHHEGSTTFKALNIDYNRNIVRNMATFMDKWGLQAAEEWFALDKAPQSVSLKVPLDAAPPKSSHVITINGELVDLVHQASEFDLAAWIVTALRDLPRDARGPVLDSLAEVRTQLEAAA